MHKWCNFCPLNKNEGCNMCTQVASQVNTRRLMHCFVLFIHNQSFKEEPTGAHIIYFPRSTIHHIMNQLLSLFYRNQENHVKCELTNIYYHAGEMKLYIKCLAQLHNLYLVIRTWNYMNARKCCQCFFHCHLQFPKYL